MLACPYHGSVSGLIGLKTQWDLGTGYGEVGMVPGSLIAKVEGLYGVFLSIPLP